MFTLWSLEPCCCELPLWWKSWLSSSSPPKKRVIDLDAADPMINMVLCLDGQVPSAVEDGFYEVEDAYSQGEQIVRAGGWITREPDACIQDQGASSFLIGSEYALRYT